MGCTIFKSQDLLTLSEINEITNLSIKSLVNDKVYLLIKNIKMEFENVIFYIFIHLFINRFAVKKIGTG